MEQVQDKVAGLKEDLKRRIKGKYEYSWREDDHVYLGMSVTRVGNKVILSQETYIEDVMIKFGFTESSSVETPSPGGKITKLDCPEGDPSSNPRAKRYREMCAWAHARR